MAYYDTINLVAGDSKPELNFTLLDASTPITGSVLDPDDPSTWHPIDLTNTEVDMKFRAVGSKEVLDTIRCVKVAPYTDGKCFLQWNPQTLQVAPGTYEGELFATYPDGKVLTLFDLLKFKVRGDF